MTVQEGNPVYVPKVILKKKFGTKEYTLHGIYKGSLKNFPLSDKWELATELKKKGYEVKIIEKNMSIGKRKPIDVIEMWVKK